MGDFFWSGRHFKTTEEILGYIKATSRPRWCVGLTVHHTLIPTVAQWRGASTLEGIADYYRDTLGWDRGPQIFVAPDGFWEGTPIRLQGIHAGSCNIDHLGIEVVGNYDRSGWASPIREFAFDLIEGFHRAWNLNVNLLKGHRECLPNKSCPGLAINMSEVRNEIRSRLTTVKIEKVVTATAGARVRRTASLQHAPIRSLPYNSTVNVDGTVIGQKLTIVTHRGEETSDRWHRLLDGGFVWAPLLS